MTWKKTILSIIWGISILAWIALIIFKFTEPNMKQWVVAVTGVAIMTEVAFWTTAALLGATLLESRKKVFRFLFRRSKA